MLTATSRSTRSGGERLRRVFLPAMMMLGAGSVMISAGGAAATGELLLISCFLPATLMLVRWRRAAVPVPMQPNSARRSPIQVRR